MSLKKHYFIIWFILLSFSATLFCNDTASAFLYPFSKGGKWGYIDSEGTIVIKPNYDFALLFSESAAPVELNNKWGFIDETGNVIIKPQYDDVKGFSEGFAAIMIDNSWGFIDKTGKTIIEAKYY